MKEDLTPAMRAALELLEIEGEKGVPIEWIQLRTVMALMRRGRVELDADGERVFLPSHQHVFVPTMHMDGCHWFTWTGRCDCGAVYKSTGERSLAADPYSAIFMADDFGTSECSRCAALMAGARPHYAVEITRPVGATA